MKRGRRPSRRLKRLRHGARGTAVAIAAVALLTASQAPDLVQQAAGAGHRKAPRPAARETGQPQASAQGDDSYHTELPPLAADDGIGILPPADQVRDQSGIPATVLAAYRTAERTVGRSDPGCRLPWYLLAAIGKVESGQARGGAVTVDGTTRGRILGPVLDGRNFALVKDSDGGAYDGDTVYDRAVGPMQFLPSTWSRWGADGNGDGRRNPDNVFDAALAAGHYLCAGGRDLGVAADLDRAVLSYNYSGDYLQLVRYWLEFYRSGVHTVPDGKGVIPDSPGAGGKIPATRPVGHDEGGGIVIGPQPSGSPGHPGRPSPGASPGPTPHPSDTGGPSPDPTDTGGSPGPTGDPTPSDPGSSDPGTGDPGDPATTPPACPTGTPSPDPSATPTDPPTDDPCATPSPSTSAGT